MPETSEPMEVAPSTALRQPYRDIWAAAALQVLRQLAGDTGWKLDLDATMSDPQCPVELAAHWELSGALAGKLQIRLHREAAHGWARLMHPEVAAADDKSPVNEHESEAVEEVLRRVAAAAEAGLAAGGWGEVEIELRHLGPLRRNVEAGDSEFPLRFQHPEREPLELDMAFDAALREQFRRGPSNSGWSEPPVADRAAAPFDLLLDVELDVTLRFGGRQMLLHDVLDLAPGSVLELDRQIDDPVELLVGGKVAAWGEVVVVDGNYGLRITRLARRRDRLAGLGGEQ